MSKIKAARCNARMRWNGCLCLIKSTNVGKRQRMDCVVGDAKQSLYVYEWISVCVQMRDSFAFQASASGGLAGCVESIDGPIDV
jgi:hypothetical protein